MVCLFKLLFPPILCFQCCTHPGDLLVQEFHCCTHTGDLLVQVGLLGRGGGFAQTQWEAGRSQQVITMMRSVVIMMIMMMIMTRKTCSNPIKILLMIERSNIWLLSWFNAWFFPFWHRILGGLIIYKKLTIPKPPNVENSSLTKAFTIRASSTNTTNPFGSTFCYGYQDIIFEVKV